MVTGDIDFSAIQCDRGPEGQQLCLVSADHQLSGGYRIRPAGEVVGLKVNDLVYLDKVLFVVRAILQITVNRKQRFGLCRYGAEFFRGVTEIAEPCNIRNRPLRIVTSRRNCVSKTE